MSNLTYDVLMEAKNRITSIAGGRGPFGISVVESSYAIERKQFKFPRTRKKRIEKKWRKNPKNFKDSPGAYLVNGRTLYAHPEIVKVIRRKFSLQGGRS